MRRLAFLIAPFVLAACASEPDTDTDTDTEGVADTPAAGLIEVRDVGFSTPESVLHDPVDDVYLVSNIDGAPLDKDGSAFISRLSPDGEVLDLRWIDGASEGVELHAPKGMAILGDSLYVADIDCVRLFHRTSAEAAGSICFPEATFLNDIAIDPNNVLYVTDTGFQVGPDGFEPSGSAAIYRFAPNGRFAALAEGEGLGNPNGIAFGDRGGFVVTFGSGEIYQLGADGSRTPVLPGAEGRQLDGIVFTNAGGFLFSSWGDRAVHHVDSTGAVTRVLENVEAPADIGFDAVRNRVLVPLFMDNAVLIQELIGG